MSLKSSMLGLPRNLARVAADVEAQAEEEASLLELVVEVKDARMLTYHWLMRTTSLPLEVPLRPKGAYWFDGVTAIKCLFCSLVYSSGDSPR
tara:strand:+ start:773 stop:1048 length:276 start_codon:yes stop_codon:yes gene_type:complete